MANISGSVFILVFVMIAAVAFVGFAAYLQGHSSAANVSISTVQGSYMDASSDVNKSINQTVLYGVTTTKMGAGVPLFLAIIVMGGALYLFILAGKK
jgi:hypothetical protein